MKAILLAAGEGSRLRPFTLDKPKPMIRAANKPIAQHCVEALVANGVRDITFVLGYQRAKVQTYFGDGRRFGATITYSFQEALLGTAPALALAPRPEEPFLVLGGDNVVDASLIKRALSAPGEGPAMVVHQSTTPSRYGVVSLDGSRVERIVEKPTNPRSEWVNTGVYRLPASFHDRTRALAERGVQGLPDVIQHAIDEGVHVDAVRSSDLWADAVYPWDLLRVNGILLKAGHAKPVKLPHVHADSAVLLGEDATIGPGTVLGAGTCIGNNVEIGPHCVLENVVVFDDAQIGAGSILRNTLIGEGTRIGPRFTALSGPCDVRSADGWRSLEDFGSVIGEDGRIGGAVTFLPGTTMGNRCRIAPARHVSGTLEDGSSVV
jgi:UDP-N-acetylglucosamine diphosphorylase / glucose-1-phosphate thymidylyltransferase / UDP-N-acetylgalactosamine diphosphorylase / glucosamine-1-phosphate N-acetyltransferase / galactosamine-1-phosphate N-acetyltransferase